MEINTDLNVDTGRRVDVIVELILPSDGEGKEERAHSMFSSLFGYSELPNDIARLIIWFDKDNKATIEEIPGIMECSSQEYPVKYNAYIDPRYDAEIVAKEVEATLRCKED